MERSCHRVAEPLCQQQGLPKDTVPCPWVVLWVFSSSMDKGSGSGNPPWTPAQCYLKCKPIPAAASRTLAQLQLQVLTPLLLCSGEESVNFSLLEQSSVTGSGLYFIPSAHTSHKLKNFCTSHCKTNFQLCVSLTEEHFGWNTPG